MTPLRLPCLILLLAFLPDVSAASPLRVCATTPDLADLVRGVGGGEVEVVSFVRGPEDAHFLEPRPSMIRDLNRADALVLNGLELEIGWLPILVQQARNGRIQPGLAAYIDASAAIEPLGVPTGPVDRSLGDVHAAGCPHYLPDPVNGLRVARLLRDRLSALRPDAAGTFRRRCADFESELAVKLAGAELAALYDIEKLARLQEHGRLFAFLETQGHLEKLGGWWARFRPHQNARVVADHDQWPYLARQMGLQVVGHLEPLPGVPPTTRHLGELVDRMNQDRIRVILATGQFDRRHVDFVASRTGAKVAMLLHQTGASADAITYPAMIDHNLSAVLAALEAAP